MLQPNYPTAEALESSLYAGVLAYPLAEIDDFLAGPVETMGAHI